MEVRPITPPMSDDRKVDVDNRNRLHAIQLVAVQPMELSIRVHADPSELEDFEGLVKLESAHSPYDEEDKTLQVRVRATIPEEVGQLISLHVEIVGAFKVDENRFDKKHIEAWANLNAPLVLYPFLREQVFSLSVRVGVQGLIVPLIEVPTFNVVSANTDNN